MESFFRLGDILTRAKRLSEIEMKPSFRLRHTLTLERTTHMQSHPEMTLAKRVSEIEMESSFRLGHRLLTHAKRVFFPTRPYSYPRAHDSHAVAPRNDPREKSK